MSLWQALVECWLAAVCGALIPWPLDQGLGFPCATGQMGSVLDGCTLASLPPFSGHQLCIVPALGRPCFPCAVAAPQVAQRELAANDIIDRLLKDFSGQVGAHRPR